MNQLIEDFCRNNKGKILAFFMEQDFIGCKEKQTQGAGNPQEASAHQVYPFRKSVLWCNSSGNSHLPCTLLEPAAG